MLQLIQIDEFSSTPKYRQLANAIIEGIQQGKIKKGELLPSINEVSFEHYMARITVEKGYNYLKQQGIIDSIRGKGFYIKVEEVPRNLRIFLLFNKLSVHKKIIYDAFVKAIGDQGSIDFYIYNNDFNLFKKIVDSRDRDYTHMVLIPHFMEGEEMAVDLINSLPKEKLVLLDKLLPGIQGKFGAVYEDFEHDIYQSLQQAKESVATYQQIRLVFPAQSYYPKEIVQGFINFCRDYAFEYDVVESINEVILCAGQVYITVMEDDLLLLLERIRNESLQLGKEIGIISYNETPIKRLLFEGIATISTDFEMLGRKAAELVLSNERNKWPNPFVFISRASL
ncbi:GntR family transcriptional regulator [Aquirufa antheringensis]|uniref:GntR family transcriptional regulator n=1 Tax=Aquirufa antheringensis TaxID=2516559 RepID=UPI0010329BB7|nr:GntR family transcriptional regulator [Aquirufa antheringensis]TBH70006.1 GntR family transcriptional regulator [Aquirufa antheringensis]